MMDEIKNEVVEETIEVVENTEVPVETISKNLGTGKVAAIVGGVLALGVAAGALWKNRHTIAANHEKKQIAKWEKKGYVVTKIVIEPDGVKAVPVVEEAK